MQNILALADHIPQAAALLSTVVASCTVITMATPTKSDDQIVAIILRVLNFLSGNWGKNKNADDI